MANQEENQLPSHFSRTILSLQNDRMKIPSKFVKQHGNTMSNDVILQVGPCKLTWRLGVKRCEGQVWLLDGWKDFAEYYSIEFGHILMFGYKGKSEFDVSIYDPSDMEIQYPVNASSKSGVEFDHSEVVETEEEETDYQEEEDDDEWLKRRHKIREKFSANQSSKSRNRRATSAWDKETDDDEEEEEEEEGDDGCPLRRDKLRGKSCANRSSKKRSHRVTCAWHKGTDDEVEDDECQKRQNKIREKSCANQSSKKRNLRVTHAWDIEIEEDDVDDDDEWPQRRHKIRGKSCANQSCKKRNRRPMCAWDKETEEEDDDDDDEWPQRRQKTREKSRANQSSKKRIRHATSAWDKETDDEEEEDDDDDEWPQRRHKIREKSHANQSSKKRTPLATSAWNKETDDEVEDGECSQRRHKIREKSCANQSSKKRNRCATCVLDKETEEDDDDDDDECPQRRHIIREKSRANQSSKKRNRHATSPWDKEINDEEEEEEEGDDGCLLRRDKLRGKSCANRSSKKRSHRVTCAWHKGTDDEVEDDECTQRRHKIREKSRTNKSSKNRNRYDTTPTSAWDRVLKRAEAYESSNPCFSVRMLPKSSLCFPHTHSIRHFLGKENNGVYLKVGENERKWFVKYSIGPHPFCQVRLLEFGWSVFMKDNHLEDGDICIFELTNSKKMVYKVTIFRIADYKERDDDDVDEDDDENDERTGLNLSEEKRSQYSSTSERTKALQRAHASRCQNPFFTVVINKYHLDGKSKTFVPRAHAKTYLFETGNSEMYLTDGKKDERTWLIPYSIEGPWLQARIWTPEWRAFKDDNHLQLGDVCVFELVDSSRMEYKVTIFRVADCA